MKPLPPSFIHCLDFIKKCENKGQFLGLLVVDPMEFKQFCEAYPKIVAAIDLAKQERLDILEEWSAQSGYTKEEHAERIIEDDVLAIYNGV